MACAVALVCAAEAKAKTPDEPLFEIGVLAIGGYFPDYPAADQSHVHALPLPYIIYRGRYFQLSGNAARGIVFTTPRLSFDISASGAFRSSHDNKARHGMPGLDYTAQVGPRLNILLAHDAMYAKIDVELPVRAVFSSDLSSIDFRGFVAAPELAYTHTNFMNTGGRFKLGIGPEFATTRLMDYLYQVKPQFATPSRPQYNASGGYLGARLEASYRLPLNQRMNLFAILVPELYAGASNAASPLFKKDYGVSAGLGFSFSFYRSDTLARGELE
jgi:MipA family protein